MIADQFNKINRHQLAEIADKFGLKFIILHGSYATGRFHNDSDVDIAFVQNKGDREPSFGFLSQLNDALRGVLAVPGEIDLDLKSLERVDPLFRREVTHGGRLLYGDPADYEDLKAFAERAYEDARPLLKLEESLARKFQAHLDKIYAQ